MISKAIFSVTCPWRWKPNAATLLLLLFCTGLPVLLSAQDLVVRGRVTTVDDGLPLPGVNVLIKGTTVGTTTDTEGRYDLVVPEGFDRLIFTFIGYASEEVSLDGRAVVDVSLRSDATQLTEIVVTGVGVPVEKRKVAFAIESVTKDNLPPVPTASIDQALIGKIPGAQISSINGTPGSEISIVLRGINTLNTTTQPMILLDGVQMGATTLSSIDPATIEKVEVIQGAAAGTMYGAQGANGVIQLFTKKGGSGRVNVDFSYSVSSNEFLNNGNLRKANLHGFQTNDLNQVVVAGTDKVLTLNPEYLIYNGDVGYNAFEPETVVDKPYDQNLQYYDHFKMFFKAATTTNYHVGISGGNSQMDYSISASTLRQENNFIGDGAYNRTNLMTNLGVTLAKGLRLRTITQLIHSSNSVNLWDKQDFGWYGSGVNFGLLLTTRPFADFTLQDPEGNYGVYYGKAASVNQFNPFYEFQYAKTADKRTDILENVALTYAFPRFVSLEAQYGYNMQTRGLRHVIQNQSLNNNSDTTFRRSSWKNEVDNTGEISNWEKDRTFHNLKATANLDLDFQRDFNSSLPLKSQTQVTYDYRSDNMTKYVTYAIGMPLLPPLTATSGNAFNIDEDYKEEFVTFGYLVNQRFEYKNLAGISGGFRSDYSSAFGRGSKPFTFPRVDGFFRPSELRGWDKLRASRVIVDWKLRAAYGEAGVQPGPYQRYVTLDTKTIGDKSTLYIPYDQNNANLDVEVSKEFEVGTDLLIDGFHGVWLRNFQLALSYWKRRTDNAIFLVDAAPSTGLGSVLDNAVGLESNGVQASLITSIMKTRRLNWNLTTNFSTQQSQVRTVKGDTLVFGNRIITAGQSVGELYGNMMLHSVNQIDPGSSENKPFIDPSNQPNYVVASNGWVVNKATRQPYISPGRYSLGNPNPKFMMTFINEFAYKDMVRLSFQVDWLAGNHLYNSTKQWMYRDGVHSDFEIPIQIDSVYGAYAAFYRGAYTPGAAWFKNYFYEDASFVRLRNVSIGIDLAKVLKNWNLRQVQLVFSGRNLWTWTKYTGMDPEISTYGVQNDQNINTILSRGEDDTSRPNLRSFQFTLNVGI